MKLKRLQMQGFKSFVDKTELVFDQQILGIVGPNGCGKSNIVDAIRWVMGEQSAKGLRGSDMKDVIFSGTSTRKAAGYAEVNLVFDNADAMAPAPYTDCHEIMITRRLYRSGESEYLVNQVQARLKDINDLFLGTGSSAKAYSIVQQGKVDQIVMAKPEDLRMLIEEAAGISKYKVRKQAAERRMEATRNNLARVEDIIRELERNAKSLEKQVAKAEKFRELQGQLRRSDELLIATKVKRLDALVANNDDELRRLEDEQQKWTTQLSELEAKLERQRLESLNSEKQTNTTYEKLMDAKDQLSKVVTESELLSQKIDLLRNQIAERKKDIERISSKSEDQSSRKNQLLEELRTLEAEEAAKDQSLQEKRKRVESAQQRLGAVDSKKIGLQKELDQLRTDSARESQKQEMLQAERVQLELSWVEQERRAEELQHEINQWQEKKKSFDEKWQEQNQHLSALEAELKDLEQAREQTDKERESLLDRKAGLQKEVSDVQASLQSMQTLEEHQHGYERGALEFSRQTGESLLMQKLEFKEEYRELGEILAYHIGQCFVRDVDDEVHIEGRWSHLRLLGETEGALPRTVLELVRNEVSQTLRKVLASIELVPNLADTPAARHAQLDLKGNWRAPFSEDVYWESHGKLAKQDSPLGRQNEIKTLEAKQQDLTSLLRDAEEKLKANQEKKELQRQKVQEQHEKIKKHREGIHELENSQQDLLASLTKAESQQAQANDEMKSLDKRIQQLTEELSNLRESIELRDRESDLKALQQESQELKEEKEQAEADLMEYRIECGALKERVERLRQQTVDLDMTQSEYTHNQSTFQADIQNWESEIQSHETRKQELAGKKQELERNIQELEKQLAESKESLAKLRSELEQSEAERQELIKKKESSSSQLQDKNLEKQNLKHQVDELSRLLDERYQVSIQDVLERVSETDLGEVDEQALESEVKSLRAKLQSYGDVNLVALQEFEELKNRLEFMNKQREDLMKTLDGLNNIIERINRITEFRFRETFKAVNHNFEVLFPKLFGGGKAYMTLTDEENLLETKVEIFAEPPGKKIQAMSLLSGGEKAMTSISLLFSLFAYRPSSFCILDEVDAPLDDANTQRYNEIIQEMSSLSQFIVVTHNKRTMEVSSTLFGVTMQEPGCSKLVSVNLEEAQALAS